MNTRQLQYAIELSKTLNFSQVAEQLGISQPALSKQISSLEKELGIDLFDRSFTPIRLTPAGEHFFQEAQELLYREDQLLHSMESFKNGKSGRLTIGISPFRCLYLIPDIAKKTKERFPGIEIVLHEISSDTIRKEAVEGKYDFAIVNLPVDDSVLEVIPIEPDTLVLAVPEEIAETLSASSNGKIPSIDFSDCKELPFIVVGQSQEMRLLFERMCAASDFRPKITMEVVGLASAWAMARAGIGATLLPLQFIEHMGKDANIRLFAPNCTMNTRQPAIIKRRGQYLSEYAQYAIELLTNSDKK